jgi:pimeloyl-ACP methyl ester carboxylesterase
MERRVAAADGVELACEVAGSGPPLVLVHGAAAGRAGFALLRPWLESTYEVWTYDRRGRGGSSDGAAPYALAQEVEDLRAVLAAAGEDATLVAHSYGGLVAAAAAPRLPGVRRLVLYEPPAGGVLADEPLIERIAALTDAGELDAALVAMLEQIGGYAPEDVAAMQTAPGWATRRDAARALPRELRAERAHRLNRFALAQLRIPVLLLLGGESPEWARRSTVIYAEAIPGARVRVLEGEGHGAAASAPQLLAAEIRAFAD